MKVETVSFPLLFVLFVCKSSLMASAEHAQQPSQGSEEEPFHNNYPTPNHYGRNPMGIPFRPVRRIGSEFLGKRSERLTFDDHQSEMSEAKRALGSEFLGKRRLGSEFLGKRSEAEGYLSGLEEIPWPRPSQLYDQEVDKRALGSEFLGKRRQNLWDWSWKRGLGSEFLGKRVLGSEFLGKRDHAGLNEMRQDLESTGPASMLSQN